MPLIELTLRIHAPVERCFDLARSIDLHRLSTPGTTEEAIAGVTSGLIGIHEEVTWRARHLGVLQTLTSRITALDYPAHFRDEMVQGVFNCIRHDHYFSSDGDHTVMRDVFWYISPCGWLGKLADVLFLKSYMRRLLIRRNQVLKAVAETDHWVALLASGRKA